MKFLFCLACPSIIMFLLQGHTIVHAQLPETRMKAYKKERNLEGNKSVDIGNDFEEKALKKFSAILNHYEVVKVGMIVQDKYCFFAASPDALLRDKGGERPGIGLLEIKCFTSANKVNFWNKYFRKSDVPYLNDQGLLKKSHRYYTQIQLTMWVTNASYAFLFIYSGVDSATVPVPYNADFV